jgi:hypothetical protein
MPTPLRYNQAERTVLTYRKLEFGGDWESIGSNSDTVSENVFQPVRRQAELLVVTEGATGVLETHWFIVRRRPTDPHGMRYLNDGVIVPTGENIVCIPERCVKRADGDHTKCKKWSPR